MRRRVFIMISLLVILFSLSGKAQSIENKINKETATAFVLTEKNMLGEAIKLSEKTLNQAIALKNDSLMAFSYNNLGISYSKLGNIEKGVGYFIKAKEHFEIIKDTLKRIVILNNIGESYDDIRKYHESVKYFREVLQLAESTKDDRTMLYPLYSLGNSLGKDKQFEQSLTYLNKALPIAIKFKDKRVASEIYQAIGYSYTMMKVYEKGESYYLKSIELSERNNYFDLLTSTYKKLATLYKFKNDILKENKTLLLYVDASDKLSKNMHLNLIKEVESNMQIKENKEKIELIKKEKNAEEQLLNKTKFYNGLLIILISLLAISLGLVYNRNRKLTHSRRKTEELSQAKASFYSEISHELRTPLYAVIELTNLMLKEDPKPSQKEYLKSLKFSGNHLLALINNVLQLNKIESGKIQIEKFNFHLKDLVSSLIDSVDIALSDSRNKIELKYDNSIPETIIGDSLKLSQIIINLISNAIKFTQEGIISIEIKKHSETENDVKLFFKVSDTGKGIPFEKQADIFKDYYQESSTKKLAYKGTGLGLSIVKKTLELLGSEIKLESYPEKGSAFSFELIFEKDIELHKIDSILEEKQNQIKDYRIIIIDDNKINLMVTRKILEGFNVKCDVATNGYQGIEMIKTNQYDCALVDLHMPEIDGYETAKIIYKSNPEMAIIALTAATSEEIHEKIESSNIDNYVLKPFITNNFIKIIVDTVNKKKKTD